VETSTPSSPPRSAENPTARYRSAEALALDIERYLAGYPVRARPATLRYRAGKFVGRHRGGVALTGLLLIGMLVSLVLAVSQGAAARRDAAAAHAAVARADSLRDFMFDAFGEAEPGAPKNGPASIVDVIERALANIETEAGTDPRVRIELQTRLAQVMSSQGKAARAGEILAGAEAFAQRQLAPGDPLRLELDQVIADNLGLRGRYDEALQRTDKLLAELPADASRLRIRVLTNSAWVAGRLHQQERGLRDGRAALALARSFGDERELQQAERALGTVLLEFGQLPEAIGIYEGLLARERAQYGPVHTRVAAEEAALSRAYRRSGDLERAEAHARAAIAIDQKVYSGDHWHTGLHLNALTMVLVERRAFDQALLSQVESQRINRATLGEDHPDVLMGGAAQGLIAGQLGDWPAAVALTRRAVDALALAQNDRTRNGVRAHRALGFALAMTGARREGEAELEKAFAIASTLDASVADDKLEVLERLARVALMAHDTARADESIERLVAQAAAMPPSTNWAGRIDALRGEALFQRGRMPEAMAALDAAATELARSTRPQPVETVVVAVLRAVVARELGESARADELTRDARARLAALPFPPPHVTGYAARLPVD
jgi:serine/threonine-protein kinase